MIATTNTQNKLRFIFAIVSFALFMTAGVATAQFPSKPKTAAKSSPLAGSWTVTNQADNQIDIEMNSEGQFRMSVNKQVSGGSYETSGNSVTLNFSNGESQTFNWQHDGKHQLSFRSKDTGSTFVMKPSNTSGDSAAEERTETNKVQGDWYAHMVSGPISVLMKTEFNTDGTYKTVVLMKANGQKETSTDTGNWTTQGSQLITRSKDTGDQESLDFQFVDGNLIIDASKEFGTKITLYRNRDEVQPVKFDLEKLQQIHGNN